MYAGSTGEMDQFPRYFKNSTTNPSFDCMFFSIYKYHFIELYFFQNGPCICLKITKLERRSFWTNEEKQMEWTELACKKLTQLSSAPPFSPFLLFQKQRGDMLNVVEEE